MDPNLRDGDGATPLHFAASRGHLTAVRWLLSNGAQLSLDKYGKSPINDAAENQQVDCLNVLVQHGSITEQNSSSGSSNYEGNIGRTKLGDSQKKFKSNPNIGSINNDYYNTKQKNFFNNIPNQHSLHLNQPTTVHHQQQRALSPPTTSKVLRSPESSTSNSCSSDTEPFYLHPPSIKGGGSGGPIVKDGLIYSNDSHVKSGSPTGGIAQGGNDRTTATSPTAYGSVLPNDGLYVNPMRQGSLTPPSPGGSISGESFYLHDPQEVIYNRVKDLFDSDSSTVNNTYQSNNSSKRGGTKMGDGSGSMRTNSNALTGKRVFC